MTRDAQRGVRHAEARPHGVKAAAIENGPLERRHPHAVHFDGLDVHDMPDNDIGILVIVTSSNRDMNPLRVPIRDPKAMYQSGTHVTKDPVRILSRKPTNEHQCSLIWIQSIPKRGICKESSKRRGQLPTLGHALQLSLNLVIV